MQVIQKILLEEEEDDDFLLYYLHQKRRRSVLPMYRNRIYEGSFETLIKRHFNEDEKTFRNYCRLNKNQFNFVLSLIKKDLLPKTTRTVITPEEKLFLTLR